MLQMLRRAAQHMSRFWKEPVAPAKRHAHKPQFMIRALSRNPIDENVAMQFACVVHQEHALPAYVGGVDLGHGNLL